jgi:hypothetical protein
MRHSPSHTTKYHHEVMVDTSIRSSRCRIFFFEEMTTGVCGADIRNLTVYDQARSASFQNGSTATVSSAFDCLSVSDLKLVSNTSGPPFWAWKSHYPMSWSMVVAARARCNEASCEAQPLAPDAAAHPLQRGRRIVPLSCTPSDVRRWPRDIPYMVLQLQDRRGMTLTCDGPPAAHSPHCETQLQLACDRSNSDFKEPSCNTEDHSEAPNSSTLR